MPSHSRVEPRTAADSAGLGALSGQALRAALRAGLDPIEAPPPPAQSDHDLNPEIPLPIDGLQPAAVLVAIIEHAAGPTVLFTQRADQLRRHAGQIAFPGGRCEPDETVVEAALREAQEEVGLDPALVEVAGLGTPYRTLTGYHIAPVVGFVRPQARFAPSAAEVADLFEVPFAFLMDPANHERRHRDQPPGPPRWHYAITWRERVIWGVTAGMVRSLYERLEGARERGA